jgi:hypothetical protein
MEITVEQYKKIKDRAEPELVYPESTEFKSTRPSASGDPTQNSTGHSNSGFALERSDGKKRGLWINPSVPKLSVCAVRPSSTRRLWRRIALRRCAGTSCSRLAFSRTGPTRTTARSSPVHLSRRLPWTNSTSARSISAMRGLCPQCRWLHRRIYAQRNRLRDSAQQAGALSGTLKKSHFSRRMKSTSMWSKPSKQIGRKVQGETVLPRGPLLHDKAQIVQLLNGGFHIASDLGAILRVGHL